MHLSSILNEYGIDIEHSKIVRHPLTRSEIKQVYDMGMIDIYQSLQSQYVYKDCKYIISFVGTVKTEAKFIGVYEIFGVISGPDVKKYVPEDYPLGLDRIIYQTKKLDVMGDLDNRLIIDWGRATQKWCQRASTDKKVLSIASRDLIPFPGYESLIVSFSELEAIVMEDERYEKWRDALRNVNAIYLICDTKRNKQYIGSTYNDNGVLGRWSSYYYTHDGGDIEIGNHLNQFPLAYLDFQYTILKVLPNSVSSVEAIQFESLYKNKLCTRNKDYGLNDN